ncbi:MAG: TIGR03087 family PEP-CTERM/XrtA system glycosyltransferase [Phycisphaerae bacterium]
MNILYLAHRIPYPPNKGDKLRAFRQLERLARSHRVWCACFVDTPSDRQYVDGLRDYCQDVIAIDVHALVASVIGLGGLLCGGTITERFYRNAEMDAALRSLTGRVAFDVAVAFSSGMAPYALAVPAGRRVLDLCDVDSLKWQDYAAATRPPIAWAYRTEGRRLARREVAWIDAFDATLLITPAEAGHLPPGADSSKIHVVGNGVHLPPLRRDRGHRPGPTVGFVGMMDYRPNVDAVEWFCCECWPAVRRRWPSATFRIVGRRPVRSVQRLADLPGVSVVGEVESVQQELARFDVSVAPMRIARGLQNKVLEAMAAALPVVLTTEAAEGIDGVSGQEFFIEDDPAAMASRVSGLLGDALRRWRVGRAARRYVDAAHAWERQLDRFEVLVTGTGCAKHAPKPVSMPADHLGRPIALPPAWVRDPSGTGTSTQTQSRGR